MVNLILSWLVWTEIECHVHTALPKWPINQFKPDQQSRQHDAKSLLPWYLYMAWSETLGLLANSPSSNKGMQIRRWTTIKLKQWVLYNRSKILHMAVPKEGISCLYLVKTWVHYVNDPTSHMISWLQLIPKWYHQFRSLYFTIRTFMELTAKPKEVKTECQITRLRDHTVIFDFLDLCISTNHKKSKSVRN